MRSNLLYLSAACAAAASMMLSCGSSAHPEQLAVRLPPHFSGKVHVMTCVAGAPAEDVPVDERGLGQTSLCPAADHSVEVEIIDGGRHYRLSAPQVSVRRTGDGLPTSIEADALQ